MLCQDGINMDCPSAFAAICLSVSWGTIPNRFVFESNYVGCTDRVEMANLGVEELTKVGE